MTNIKPFKAVVYNPEKIKDLSSVVCPPYDVISPVRQDYFHKKDPHNLIHLILGKDIPGEDKYQRSALLFKEWLKNKVLIQEEKPVIFFYAQEYWLKCEKRVRFGLIGLLRLADKKKAVFGHEHTRKEPKEDRTRLFKAVKANLSPIFVIFPDKKRIIRFLQDYVKVKKPHMQALDDEKTIHRVWRIDSPEMLEKIQKSMQPESMFIADGHHRYEVASNFRDEMFEKLGNKFTGEEDFNYVMAYFTNTDPQGLTILPINRLIKRTEALSIEDFLSELSGFFNIEEVKDKVKFLFLLQKAGRVEHVIGMYYQKTFRLLRVKNIKMLDKMIADKPAEYRSLDVSILNYIVFAKILKMNLEDKGELEYIQDPDELIGLVDKEPANAGFFLNSVKMEQIMSVALAGEKMPPKSTYFYPKVLSGLAINKLEDV